MKVFIIPTRINFLKLVTNLYGNRRFGNMSTGSDVWSLPLPRFYEFLVEDWYGQSLPHIWPVLQNRSHIIHVGDFGQIPLARSRVVWVSILRRQTPSVCEIWFFGKKENLIWIHH
jgi:hypothetical protein